MTFIAIIQSSVIWGIANIIIGVVFLIALIRMRNIVKKELTSNKKDTKPEKNRTEDD
mgnify:CR=1 FL=1